MMTGLLNLLKSQERRVADVMTWMAFPLSVPLMRLTQDGKEERFKLFIRDFSTLFFGAGIFFLTKGVSGKLLDVTGTLKQHPEMKRLLSLGTGLSANALFSGLGAVKLSHWAQDQLSSVHKPFKSPERFPDTVIIKGGKRPVEMVILPNFSGANTLAVKPMTHVTTGLDVLSSPWQVTSSGGSMTPYRVVGAQPVAIKPAAPYLAGRSGLWPPSGGMTI